MTTTRRDFLRGMTAATAMGGLGASLGARAAGPLVSRRVPGRAQDFKVLEIFLAGALSHRETIWVERADELPNWRRIDQLDGTTTQGLTNGAPQGQNWLLTPGDYAAAAAKRLGVTATRDIDLGPGCVPLWTPMPGAQNRMLKDRLRVVAMGHDLFPHPPAQELVATGSGVEVPQIRRSGLGAAIARHTGLPGFVLFDDAQTDPRYVAGRLRLFGSHGSENAPIPIPYANADIVQLLNVQRRAERDDLAAYFRARYADRLTFAHANAFGERARSKAFDQYDITLDGTFQANTLGQLFGGLAGNAGNTIWDNPTRRAIQAAVAVLSQGASAYCAVADGGVIGDGNGFSQYDQHGDRLAPTHGESVTGNILNVMRTLWEEVDAGNLDLDETLVVFTTEFGRAWSQEEGGSDHCTSGFAVAVLGGPIAQGDGGLVGDLTFQANDNAALLEPTNVSQARPPAGRANAIHPTDFRAAILQAAGIHPFQADVFEVAQSSSTEGVRDDAADEIATTLFG